MNKNYLIKNYSFSDKEPKLIFINGPKELLIYIDEHKNEKISIYECECVVDWS